LIFFPTLTVIVDVPDPFAIEAGLKLMLTPVGQKGLIKVRTACENNAVVISIADTGCGIPENIRDKIFDPFFTTKKSGKGTGQGLAIARSVVVDRHRGTLTFTSEVGKGTTFNIRLPLDEGVKGKENLERERTSSSSASAGA
jgi:signal transduction histidine kinase